MNKSSRVLPREKRRKLALRFIFIALLFLIGICFLFRETIFGPQRFDGQKRYSFIVDTSQSLILFSVSPLDRSISIVTIDPETYLSVPNGMGTYKASSIYRLGNLERSQQFGGGGILSQTAQETFGVPIEGYIRYNSSSNGFQMNISSLEDWESFKKERFGFVPMISFIKDLLTQDPRISTNIHPFEIFGLFRTLSGNSTLQVKVIDLKAYEAVSPFTLSDKSKVFRIDPNRLDKILEGMFQEERILRENISVGVLNASRASGVAGTSSRIVSNMGARVVSVSNAEDLIPESCYLSGTREVISSYTVSRLVDVFGCRTNILKSSDEMSGPYTLEFLVGEGYSN